MSELVIASDEAARSAHQELYHLPDGSYVMAPPDLLGSVVKCGGMLRRLHVASSWTGMLKLAAWRDEPKAGDIFLILKSAGVTSDELFPFRDASAEDFFPWLYYGKRFDVLRKICRIAKANAEKHLMCRETRVHCHLVAEDSRGIVASSL